MARKELLEAVLTKFAKFVIQQARTNLTKGKHNFDKTLYNSLKYKLFVGENSFTLGIEMEDYGDFQDKGVKGAGGTRKSTSPFNRRNNKGKIWKQKAPDSPYSYKEGKKPSVKHFKRWAESKGLNPFAVRESVYRQGIPATKFFSTPFRLGFAKLPPELIQSFQLGKDDLQAFTRKDLNIKL
jgi:hypothetical protein